MKCLQCGSSEIAVGVRAVDKSEMNTTLSLCLETYTNPSAAIFKGSRQHPMSANVCTKCGFVMLSVSLQDAARIGKRTNQHPLDRQY